MLFAVAELLVELVARRLKNEEEKKNKNSALYKKRLQYKTRYEMQCIMQCDENNINKGRRVV